MDIEEKSTEMLGGTLSDKLGEVLSDPAQLASLAKMASSLAGSGLLDGLVGGTPHDTQDAAKENEVPQATERQSDTVHENAVARVGAGTEGLHIATRHKALLLALKPYLGAEKKERIDRMLKLLQLADIATTVLSGGERG